MILINSAQSHQGLHWKIDLHGHLHEFYLKSDEALAPNDSSFPLALFTSMLKGEPVQLPVPCCETLFKNSKQIVDQFRGWFPELAVPQFVDPQTCLRSPAKNPRVGLFFTCGVDSFYSLLQNQQEITDLIFVHGFDIDLDNHELREEVSEAVREVARHFGKNLIEVETDVRKFLEQGLKLHWPYSHGAALATVAHSLSHLISKVYLASSHATPDVSKWGTHPHVDPHWSSSALQVVHEGYEATRIDKLRRIAQSAFALSKVRVCWENRSNHYNCGECEKCIRTMLAMRIAGCLNEASTFARPFEMKSLKVIDRFDEVDRYYLRENRKALAATGGDLELLKQLDAMLAPPTLMEQTLYRIGKTKRVKRFKKRLKRLRERI